MQYDCFNFGSDDTVVQIVLGSRLLFFDAQLTALNNVRAQKIRE